MKSETESRKDDLVNRIGELARDAQKLARVAVQQYSAEVEAILKAQDRDARRIERCLDGMLDFCFDEGMLVLYKKLCRHYFDIDPEATVSYVHAYREMWDEQKPDKGPLDGETRQRGHVIPDDKKGHKGDKGIINGLNAFYQERYSNE
ncbi:MAG: hypothetical protein PHT49_08945 [Desulfovibrionales bacterium]|nr:hypothetical protein [Desulfovibrionales bacterium]